MQQAREQHKLSIIIYSFPRPSARDTVFEAFDLD